jgi:hypothetical protein
MTWDASSKIVHVYNNSGEEIPPFAAMELDYQFSSSKSCVTVENEQVYWYVKKPTSAGASDSTRIVFNGPFKIADEGYGYGVINSVVLALLDDTAADAAIGEDVGAVDGSWYLKNTGNGWKLKTKDVMTPAYEVSSAIKSVYVQAVGGGGSAILAITPVGGIAGRATGSVPHTFPSATCDLIDASTGDYYDPNETEVIYNSTSITIDADHIIQAKMINGRYFVDVDDCS